MDGSDPSPLAFRPRVLIWTLAVIGCLLMAVVIAAWIVLPIWQPRLVVEHSPFYEPARRAALTGREYTLFLERLPEWPVTALADAHASLLSSERERVWLAVRVIDQLKPPDAIDLLRDGLKNPDDHLYSMVLYGMTLLGPQTIVPELIRALELRPVLDGPRQLATRMREDDFPLTLALRTAPDKERRAIACLLVAKLKLPEAVDYLLGQIGQVDLPNTIRPIYSWDAATEALAINQSDAATLALIREMAHADAKRRYFALHASMRNPDERLTKAMIPLLDDPVEMVAKEAAQRLARRFDPTALAAVDRALSDGHPAAKSLIPHGSYDLEAQQLPVLVKHLAHPEFGERILGAVLDCGKLGGHEADVVLDHLARLEPDERDHWLHRTNDRGFSAAQQQRLTELRAALTTRAP